MHLYVIGGHQPGTMDTCPQILPVLGVGKQRALGAQRGIEREATALVLGREKRAPCWGAGKNSARSEQEL